MKHYRGSAAGENPHYTEGGPSGEPMSGVSSDNGMQQGNGDEDDDDDEDMCYCDECIMNVMHNLRI